MNPDFVDNRDGNTLARAINDHAGWLVAEGHEPQEVCVASAYFNPAGFRLILPAIESTPRVRLLLGAEPTPEAEIPDRRPEDPPEPGFTQRRLSTALDRAVRALRRERDHQPFSPPHRDAVRSLLEVLRSGKVEVRRYERRFLHGKAFLFRSRQHGMLTGSSNLTRAGLGANLELNVGHYDDPVVGKVQDWYEDLWNDAAPFDLAAIYAEPFQEFPPYMIYLYVLWRLYGDEVEEERATSDIPITSFQRHGVWRALKILDRCGGVLIADGVGLGKTYSAGEIITRYRERRQRVLLVCPAALRAEWRKFFNRFQIFAEIVSYEQLAGEPKLGGDHGTLDGDIDEVALVVIDEAHNYRNPDTRTRAQVLRSLMAGPRRDLVLLTATPVNNSLWDLYQLLRYFLKQDAHLSERGILSIRERFELAMRQDPFNLNPDLLYPIIDATTVKRTRQFIKKHYQDDLVRDLDGRLVPIRFARPHASKIEYDLDEAMPGFLGEFEAALQPERGEPELTMARYSPDLYRKGATGEESNAGLVGLIRTALLKRFESSTSALSQTCQRMAREHELFLRALDQGKVVSKEVLHEWSAADDDAELDGILDGTRGEVHDAAEFDVVRLRADVQRDMELLDGFFRRADAVQAHEDPKLAALVEELVTIAKEARDGAIDREDERNRRKVLVFSAFQDTIDWIETYLRQVIASDDRLEVFRDRIASASGEDIRSGVHRDDAVYGFAPISTRAPEGREADRFDLLLATDVLAEGMNLQQCRNIINYDLPWNPMRLVQRHGRIDRINSPHPDVFLRTFFPDEQLERLLRLEERVRRKLAHAAHSVGVETAPIKLGATGAQSFAETRDEIERLREGDASIFERGGTRSAAQSGEEYRQELRKGLEARRQEIELLPWQAGSGLVKGDVRGHVFCAAVGDRTYLRFVPVEGGAEQVVREPGTCLRLLECEADTERVLPPDLADGVYAAWEMAREDIWGEWMWATEPRNLQPKVRPLNREVAEHLRKHPPDDIEEKDLTQALNAIEAPWPLRDERQLRAVFQGSSTAPMELSRRVIEEVKKIGAEPFHPPKPLPLIERDDVHLVVWMAVEADGSPVGQPLCSSHGAVADSDSDARLDHG